jgi:uncharacterized caspase-like protein
MKHVRKLSFVIALTLLAACAGRASAAAQDGSDSKNPKLYVLAIGIRQYHNYGRRNPSFADKDARDFAATVEQAAKGSFADIETRLLINGQATRASIESAIKDIITRARPQDTFMFFYSGHGESNAERGGAQQFYLIPSDFNRANGDNLVGKGISATQLQYWFIQVESQHQFIILDSNKSDRGFRLFKERIDRENQILQPLAQRNIAILSIRGISFEFNSLRNGLLTYVILQGLKGGAALNTGHVTVKNLVSYVISQSPVVLRRSATARTRALLRRYPGSGRPFVYVSGDDFTLGSRISATGESSHPSLALADVRRGHGQSQVESVDGSDVGGLSVKDSEQSKSRYIPLPQCKSFSKAYPSNVTSDRRGKDVALIIGTDHYDHWPLLNSPVLDASSLAVELNTRYGFEVEVLKDPTLECIGDALYRYGRNREYAADAQLFIFFSGHGHYRDDLGLGLLIAKDSPRVDPLAGNSLNHAILRRLVDNIPCDHILLVIDACFSGTIDEPLEKHNQMMSSEVNAMRRSGVPAIMKISESRQTPDEFVRKKMRLKTRQFLTSGGKEYVPDGGPGEHSPFAGKLLEALEKTGNEDEYITMTQIFSVMERVDPEPYWGRWGNNDARSQFFFFFQR